MLIVDMTWRHYKIRDIDMSYRPDVWFYEDFKPEWFDDKIVRQLIETIDRNEFIEMPTGKGAWKSNYIMNSDVLGYVDPSNLSTGVKSLILSYKTSRPIRTKSLGDNCIQLLPYLGDLKDITVDFDCLRPMDIEKCKLGVKLKQSGKVYHNNIEFGNDMLKATGGGFDEGL